MASLPDIQKTRFLALNYARLQGLRVVPLGLLLFLVTLWANAQRGPARDFLLPVLAALSCAALYWAIDRYYRRAYGWVAAGPQPRLGEIVLSVAGGALGLAAFWVDVSFSLPVSLIGLLFSAGFVIEFVRLARRAGRWYAPMTPLFAALLLALSLLPALGAGEWWRWVGAKAEMLAICMAAGLVVTVSGVVSHLYFTRELPREARHA
jgi:hypothetical protein